LSDLQQQTDNKQSTVSAVLPTSCGDGQLILFDQMGDGKDHFAFAFGTPSKGKKPLVRVHSECITGEVFGSLRCDCKWQLETAIRMISEAPNGGYIIYLRQEGRGIGVKGKLKAYNLQDKGYDTAEANEKLGYAVDERSYELAAKILLELECSQVDLLTNNPDKIKGLKAFGVRVDQQVSIEAPSGNAWDTYLKTKAAKLGHTLNNY
jgi:3,4-dihydroxy 2-butanone 4-phosphate synthase/GTP cyclohydrolase II